jgi:hypothetical protein
MNHRQSLQILAEGSMFAVDQAFFDVDDAA